MQVVKFEKGSSCTIWTVPYEGERCELVYLYSVVLSHIGYLLNQMSSVMHSSRLTGIGLQLITICS